MTGSVGLRLGKNGYVNNPPPLPLPKQRWWDFLNTKRILADRPNRS